MTVVEIPPGRHMTGMRLGGRFRLDERISLDDQVSGPCGSSWETHGLSLWKATDQLLSRPVTIYLLPPGPVPRAVTDAVQSAAKVSDPRLATIYDTDFGEPCPYIVAEWTPGTHLEALVLSGLPSPALDAALCGVPAQDPVAADTTALARMLYALLTGYWPGDEPTALPPAPRHKGQVCTPRQVRAGVPALLDAIAYRGLRGQAADAPLRPQTPAGLALALNMVQRPSYQLEDAVPVVRPGRQRQAQRQAQRRQARHARARAGFRQRTTLLRPAV